MHTDAPLRPATWDLNALRADFPLLQQQVNGQPLVYLDNAATTQKPRAVIEAISQYYCQYNANVHRGAHWLSDQATAAFEQARVQVQQFIKAPAPAQIIWTRGTTESINLVAQSYLRPIVQPGQTIVVSAMEHHANIVPWQMVAQQTGAQLVVLPVDDRGELVMAALERCIDQRTALVALTHASNALGSINPVRSVIARAHQMGAKVLLDGAQAVGHLAVDVQALDCDFYAFSGHKCFGPTGIGVLYGRRELLEQMPPYQGGGEMIAQVSFERTIYNDLPYKFEAGTPNIAGAIGLAAALRYLNGLDLRARAHHEAMLLQQATNQAQTIDGLRIIGQAADKISVLSFVLDGVHPADLGALLDQQGIAVRTGHHCAQPIMEQYGLNGTVRASFAFYTTLEDIERLFSALRKATHLLGGG